MRESGTLPIQEPKTPGAWEDTPGTSSEREETQAVAWQKVQARVAQDEGTLPIRKAEAEGMEVVVQSAAISVQVEHSKDEGTKPKSRRPTARPAGKRAEP